MEEQRGKEIGKGRRSERWKRWREKQLLAMGRVGDSEDR